VAASAVTTATVEVPASAVEATSAEAAVEPAAAASGERSAAKAFMSEAAPAEATAPVKPPASVVASASVITSAIIATTPVATAPPISIPRASSNEHAVYEPIWAVVAVRSAGIRIIIIIAVGANWRRAYISRAIVGRPHSDANKHPLRARKRRAKEANAEYRRNP
jgi:hypothetical protein